MENSILNVNIDSLKKVSNELSIINKNIINYLSIIENEYNNDLDEILSTNASKQYKEKVMEYLDKTSKDINENNTYFVNKLDEIIQIYSELNGNIEERVRGESNER